MKIPIVRSFLVQTFGTLLVGGIGVVATPLFIRSLGKEEYGLLNLLGTVTSQLVLLDLGIRQAFLRFIPLYRDHPEKLSSLLSTSAWLVLLLSIVGGGALLLLTTPIITALNIPPHLYLAAHAVLLLYTIDGAFELLASLPYGVLAGAGRYDILSTLNLGRSILSTALILVALKVTSFGIWAFVAIGISVRMVVRYLAYRSSRREVTRERLFGVPSVAMGRELLRYSAWNFVLTLFARGLYHTDTVFAGMFFGVGAVTLYAAAQMLVEQLRMLVLGAQGILVSRLSGGEDTTLIAKCPFYLQLVAIGICIPLAASGPAFMKLWLGAEYSVAGDILGILVLPYLLIAPSLGVVARLYARARHKIATLSQIAEVLFNLPFSLWLLHKIGIVGIAYGTALSATLFSGILLPVFAMREGEYKGYLVEGFAKALPYAFVQAVALLGLQLLIPPTSWLNFLLLHIVATLIYGVVVIGTVPELYKIVSRLVVLRRER